MIPNFLHFSALSHQIIFHEKKLVAADLTLCWQPPAKTTSSSRGWSQRCDACFSRPVAGSLQLTEDLIFPIIKVIYSKVSTKYNCHLQVFILNGVKRVNCNSWKILFYESSLSKVEVFLEQVLQSRICYIFLFNLITWPCTTIISKTISWKRFKPCDM